MFGGDIPPAPLYFVSEICTLMHPEGLLSAACDVKTAKIPTSKATSLTEWVTYEEA